MTIGKLARKLLGNKIFSIIARYYRAIFVDLEKVCRSFPEIEDNAHILDVGGGDGELINILLSKKKYIKITMIDISPQVGRSIKPEFMDRVICLPNTGLLEYQSLNDTQIDYILISDVIHHVKRTNLLKFFSDLKILISYNKTKIIIYNLLYMREVHFCNIQIAVIINMYFYLIIRQ